MAASIICGTSPGAGSGAGKAGGPALSAVLAAVLTGTLGGLALIMILINGSSLSRTPAGDEESRLPWRPTAWASLADLTGCDARRPRYVGAYTVDHPGKMPS